MDHVFRPKREGDQWKDLVRHSTYLLGKSFAVAGAPHSEGRPEREATEKDMRLRVVLVVTFQRDRPGRVQRWAVDRFVAMFHFRI